MRAYEQTFAGQQQRFAICTELAMLESISSRVASTIRQAGAVIALAPIFVIYGLNVAFAQSESIDVGGLCESGGTSTIYLCADGDTCNQIVGGNYTAVDTNAKYNLSNVAPGDEVVWELESEKVELPDQQPTGQAPADVSFSPNPLSSAITWSEANNAVTPIPGNPPDNDARIGSGTGVNFVGGSIKATFIQTDPTVNLSTLLLTTQTNAPAVLKATVQCIPAEGDLTIAKVSKGGVGEFPFSVAGPTTVGDFTIETTTAGTPVTTTASTLEGLAPGDYTVTEALPSEQWKLTDVSCTDPDNLVVNSFSVTGTAEITVKDGANGTCTFENTKQEQGTASLTIRKIVDPDTSTKKFDFETDFDGEFALGHAEEEVFVDLELGKTYQVTELGEDGFRLLGAECEVSPTTGESPNWVFDGSTSTVSVTFPDTGTPSATCTFTNERETGSISITKKTSGGDGDFTFGLSGPSGSVALTPSILSDGQTTTASSLPTGLYTIEETDLPDGWSLEEIDCGGQGSRTDNSIEVDLDADESIGCTFRNVRDTGSITVVKETIGGNGDFAFALTGPESDTFTLSGGEEKAFADVPTGVYTIAETDLPEGWTLKSKSCGQGVGSDNQFTVTLDKGETITCTFVNFKEDDDVMDDITELFIHRRVDNLLTHGPDRARLIRRLHEQQPVSLKDTPLKFSGRLDNDTTEMTFSFSLSQAQAALAAEHAEKLRKAGESGDGLSLLDGPSAMQPLLTTRPTWDLWLEGQISSYDDNTGGIDREGTFGILYAGVDYALAPGVIVGALVQIDRTNEDVDEADLTGKVEGTGWMIGPYFGAKIGDNLLFDARVAWGQSDNDIMLTDDAAGRRTGSFDTERWLATARLTGIWYRDGWRLSPSVELAYGNEDQDAYRNSLGQKVGAHDISIGRVTFGPEIGYEHRLSNGTIVEPHASIEGIWNFDSDDLSIGGETVETDDFRARVEGGVMVKMGNGMSVRASGNFDGLGDGDFDSYGGGLWVNMPLQ